MPNTKNIEQVEELTDKLGRANAIYITEYLGLNVEDITELRREFHSNEVCSLPLLKEYLKVVLIIFLS